MVASRNMHCEAARFPESRLEETFPVEDLLFRYMLTRTKEEGLCREADRLDRHEARYGRLPLLNRKRGWRPKT